VAAPAPDAPIDLTTAEADPKELDRYVSPTEAFDHWKSGARSILEPPVVPEGSPSAVAPNGAPAANPMDAMSPRDRVMARIQRNAGVGGPA
jgi:hypothetical protein